MFGQWSVERVWVMGFVTSSQTCIKYLGAPSLPKHSLGMRETPVDTLAGLLAVLELTV